MSWRKKILVQIPVMKITCQTVIKLNAVDEFSVGCAEVAVTVCLLGLLCSVNYILRENSRKDIP